MNYQCAFCSTTLNISKKNKNIDSTIFGPKSIEQVDNLLKIYKRRSYYTNQKYTSLKKRVKTISKIFKTIDQKK